MFASRALPALQLKTNFAKCKSRPRPATYVRFCRLAVNSRPKVNGLSALYPVDYASEMNIAGAAIVTHSTRFHNRLVHSRRTIKRECTRLTGKSRHDHGCRAVLQGHEHFVVYQAALHSGGRAHAENR